MSGGCFALFFWGVGGGEDFGEVFFLFREKTVTRLLCLLLVNPQYPNQVTGRSGPIVAPVLTWCPPGDVLPQLL